MDFGKDDDENKIVMMAIKKIPIKKYLEQAAEMDEEAIRRLPE